MADTYDTPFFVQRKFYITKLWARSGRHILVRSIKIYSVGATGKVSLPYYQLLSH